jgi:8-oxo-dGTP diphosphatase
VREWLVAGAILRTDDGLLLVRNERRSGMVDWSPPGGVIDQGESVVEGLTREVEEETGLRVTRWRGPVYEVRAEAPDLGWHMRAIVHVAEVFEGEIRVDDPDGIVTDAAFFPLDECLGLLDLGHPWVREPLLEWLAAPWEESRLFGYLVEGTDLGSLSVSRR